MIKRLKILATVLFTALSTIYLTFVFMSLFIIYIASLAANGPETTIKDQIIGYAMYGTILFVSLICSISCIWYLYRDNVKFVFTLPIYLFLPLGIPYFLVMRKLKNHNEFYMFYGHPFSQFLLVITSIFNYLLAFLPLIWGLLFINAGSFIPATLFIGIPITIFALLLIIGTTANLIDNRNGNKIARRMSYMGLTLVWIYKFYKMSLVKNNLYEVNYKEISL